MKLRGTCYIRCIGAPFSIPNFRRATIYPILSRLGVETLNGRMARLREDERFKAVGPDAVVLPYPTPSLLQPALKPETGGEAEIWFDWAFVDFWKSNYCRSFCLPDPPRVITYWTRYSTERFLDGS